MHVGMLTRGGGENVAVFLVHAQPPILRIRQEVRVVANYDIPAETPEENKS